MRLTQWRNVEESEDVPFSFDRVLVLALADQRLNLADNSNADADAEDRALGEWENPGPFLVDDRLPERPPQAALFPPMTFLPDLASATWARNGSGAWNLRNDLILWILEHAEILSERAPVAYREIIKTFGAHYAEVGELNNILARVALTYPDLALPLD